MASPEDIILAYEHGKMDEWLESGQWTPEKYEEQVNAYHSIKSSASEDEARARALGVPTQTSMRMPAGGKKAAAPASNEPPELVNLTPQPQPEVAPYQTPSDIARPSAFVPGHGGAETADGDWWDAIKAKIPAEIRDATLLPSRGPVWFEPSDDEARAAIADLDAKMAEQAGRTEEWQSRPEFRRAIQANLIQAWKDERWAEAYDLAEKRGEAIYRARDINDSSPGFMQTAKKMATMMAPFEGLAQGSMESIALGPSTMLGPFGVPTVIVEDFTRRARSVGEDLGIAPFDEAEFQAETQDRIAREQRVSESVPYFKMAGSIAGALAPGGAANRLASYASKLFGATGARGAANAAVREGFAGLASTAVEQTGVQGLNAARLESAGLEAPSMGEMARSVGGTALMGGVLSSALAIPGGVSRGARGARDADAAAYGELEGPDSGTSFWTASGLKAPKASEELPPSPEGGVAQFRQRAAESGADQLYETASKAGQSITQKMSPMSERLIADEVAAQGAVDEAAEAIVSRGESLDRAADEQAAFFTERVMKRANKRLEEGPLQRKAETERALKKEGAPDYPALPGPSNFYSDIALERQGDEAIDSGLETDYPSVSSAPIIDRHNRLVQMMSFADDTHIPNTSAQKFKRAADSLFRKKVVSPEEAAAYDGVAYDMRTIEDEAGEEMVEVLLPRRMSARELDDFIKNTDELGKFAQNSADPEAARFREIGQSAAELRDQAFRVLAATKQKQHLEMLKDEEMLRALGLPSNASKMDVGTAEVAETVMKRIKEMAAAPEPVTPSTLATHHKQFANWLKGYDESLFDQYFALRETYRKKKAVNDFNVSATNQPLSRVMSVQKVADAITGDDKKYKAMMQAFGSTEAATKVARQENARVGGLMKMLKADISDMSPADQMSVQRRLQQILVEGGDNYAILRERMKPEQRAVLDVARRAAQDVDGVFTSLGFGPGKWKTADRREIIGGLHDIFSSYRAFGSKEETNKVIDEVFARSPATKKALQDMSKERAFQHLLRNEKGDSKIVAHASGIGGYFVSSKDFFINHLDALMGKGQTGKVRGVDTPFGAPSAYSIGAVSPVLSDPDRNPRAGKIPGQDLLNMLIQAYERAME